MHDFLPHAPVAPYASCVRVGWALSKVLFMVDAIEINNRQLNIYISKIGL